MVASSIKQMSFEMKRRKTMTSMKHQHPVIMIFFLAVIITSWCGVCFGQKNSDPSSGESVYTRWKAAGQFAAGMSLEMIQTAAAAPDKENLIVLTNAGYAEIFGMSTQGALDGLTVVTGASRGKNTLVEVHSAARDPLWFAVYDRQSGFCAYLEMNRSDGSDSKLFPQPMSPEMFGIRTVERIDAAYLYQHATALEARLASRIFGNNAFRVITIANAVASGAPARVIRAIEFHDHYCPGVISGIFMAGYVQTHFPRANPDILSTV
jgi:formylmethanofuran dehydrogenase subunit E-like metal-binding protein